MKESGIIHKKLLVIASAPFLLSSLSAEEVLAQAFLLTSNCKRLGVTINTVLKKASSSQAQANK